MRLQPQLHYTLRFRDDYVSNDDAGWATNLNYPEFEQNVCDGSILLVLLRSWISLSRYRSPSATT
jgi:hypothetical protein